MSNARATRLVNDISTTCGDLDKVRSLLNRVRDRYTANGGQSFIHEHFIDENGDPRTDLDLDEATIVAAVAVLSTLITTLNDNKVALIQAAP